MTGAGQTGDTSNAPWGNGAATALVLAAQGAKVFGVDINLDAAQHTQKRITAQCGEITVFAADVTKATHVKAAVDACIEKYWRIDVLVKYVPCCGAINPLHRT